MILHTMTKGGRNYSRNLGRIANAPSNAFDGKRWLMDRIRYERGMVEVEDDVFVSIDEVACISFERVGASDGGDDGNDAIAFAKRVEACVEAGDDVTLFGVNYAPVGDEPFCETVGRWLGKDAPEECRKCDDGRWAELVKKIGE